MDEAQNIALAWDIEVPGIGEVWFRAEDELGYPTQTWVNGALLQREDAGVFGWSTDVGVPTPIWHIDRLVEIYADDPGTLCYLLRGELKSWSNVQAVTEAGEARQKAYAEYARRAIAEHCQ